MKKIFNLIYRVVVPLLLIILIVVIWQIATDRVNEVRAENRQTSLEFFFPSPRNIFNSFIDNFSNIQSSIGNTLVKSFVGFIIGVFLAIAIAMLYYIFPRLRNATIPVAYAINSFPITGLIPIIVLTFGQGTFLSVVIVSILICYFPMLITIDGAFKNIDQRYVEFLRIYKANRLQILKYANIPLTLPNFFVSLRMSIPASIIGAILGEWMGSGKGIGRLMVLSVYRMEAGLLYACMVEIALICAVLTLLVELLGRKVVFWNKSS